MTFNDNARIDSGRITKRSGARKGGMIAGGGVGIALLLFIGSQLLGVDLTPLQPVAQQFLGGQQVSPEEVAELVDCNTGKDANGDVECRMAGASDSLDTYWAGQVDGYRGPGEVVLFTGQTTSGCGVADTATGPFYCPRDESIFMDVSFFNTLREDFGASGGSLSQMYVLAHEWGHHISNLTGVLGKVGNDSGPASDSVRLELQADCYAGSWVQDASTVPDSQGVPFLQPVSTEEIADALNAAAAIGDDSIMESAGMRVNPERFTHGTAEQRQRWFMTGYENGPGACATFEVPAAQL